MNSIKNPEKKLINDFIPSLNAFLKGDLVIADHSVLIMFKSVNAPVKNKVEFAKLVLEKNLLKETESRSYLENFISENSIQEIHKSITQEIRESLMRLIFKNIIEKVSNKIKETLKLS